MELAQVSSVKLLSQSMVSNLILLFWCFLDLIIFLVFGVTDFLNSNFKFFKIVKITNMNVFLKYTKKSKRTWCLCVFK